MRDIRALLAKRQISPPMAQVVLINTLVAMIKHLGKKARWLEAAEDWVRTLKGDLEISVSFNRSM
jgi:hypothetical protein